MIIHAPKHERLRRLRMVVAAHGITAKELAAACSISPAHLRFVLTGERRPSAHVLAAFKRALGENGMRFVVGLTNELAVPAVHIPQFADGGEK